MLKWTRFTVSVWVVLVVLGLAAVAAREWYLVGQVGVARGSR